MPSEPYYPVDEYSTISTKELKKQKNPQSDLPIFGAIHEMKIPPLPQADSIKVECVNLSIGLRKSMRFLIKANLLLRLLINLSPQSHRKKTRKSRSKRRKKSKNTKRIKSNMRSMDKPLQNQKNLFRQVQVFWILFR